MTLSELRQLADRVAKKLRGKTAAGTVEHSLLTSESEWNLWIQNPRRGWQKQASFATKHHAMLYLQGMLDALTRKGR